MKRVLTEELPSSGKATPHTCEWQKISEDATTITLACKSPSCPHTKRVPKPQELKEDHSGRKVLLG